MYVQIVYGFLPEINVFVFVFVRMPEVSHTHARMPAVTHTHAGMRAVTHTHEDS